MLARLILFPLVPSFSVHPEELQESTKKKLNDRGYFYANSNAGLGWTDRANRLVFFSHLSSDISYNVCDREAFYKWRIVPRALVDTNTRDLTSTSTFFRTMPPTPLIFLSHTATVFGHRIPVPIMFAPIGINKLYSPLGELIPARIAGELGIPVINSLSCWLFLTSSANHFFSTVFLPLPHNPSRQSLLRTTKVHSFKMKATPFTNMMVCVTPAMNLC